MERYRALIIMDLRHAWKDPVLMAPMFGPRYFCFYRGLDSRLPLIGSM